MRRKYCELLFGHLFQIANGLIGLRVQKIQISKLVFCPILKRDILYAHQKNTWFYLPHEVQFLPSCLLDGLLEDVFFVVRVV